MIAPPVYDKFREDMADLVAGIARRRSEFGDYLRRLVQRVHVGLLRSIVDRQARRPSRLEAGSVDRLLVMKIDGIGDLVNFTPALDALRAAFPAAAIDVVAHPGPLSLLAEDERVSNRFAYRSWMYHRVGPRPHLLANAILTARLLARRYPLVVYLRGSFPFLLLAWTSRFAVGRFVAAEHVSDWHLRAVASVAGTVERRRPTLRLGDGTRRAGLRLIGRGADAQAHVAVHPFSMSWTREWPADRYAAVADGIHETGAAVVHFFASRGERRKLDRLIRACRHPHSIHVGEPLPHVAAALGACDLFIGNDSGLGHVAAAAGVPCILIWGSSAASMYRPVRDDDRCRIMHRGLDCRAGCTGITCGNPARLRCLTDIPVAEILRAAADLLGYTAGLPA